MALKRFGENSGGGNFVKFKDLVGHLLIISPTRYEEKAGNYDLPRLTAQVVDLDAETGPEEYDRVWITGKAVVEDMCGNMGEDVAVRLIEKKSKDGKRTFLAYAAPSDEDMDRVEAFNSAVDPLA